MADKLGNENTSWVEKVFFFFFLFLFSVRMIIADQDTVIGHSHKLEVDKLLKKLNKPAAKSIKSPDEDIIDCVSILNQPPFNHPKLKNHKIKMRPNFQPQDNILEVSNEISSKSKPIVQLWHQSGSCPEGTLPIRRTREEDILRASSMQQFGKKNLKNVVLPLTPNGGGQGGYGCASVFIKGNKYYGGKGAMNVWNPNVEQSQEYSLSATWVGSDADRENIEVIEAGWQSDSSKNTGCYDLLCSGFVQVYSAVALGSSIMPLSLYNDTNSQYQITITIWKDKGNGGWWMRYGTDQIVGYWPSSLFPSLSDSATVIEWGGEVGNSGTNGQHTTTQMGSGHFAGKS
ncbi:uncharacterized protein LOC114748055 [Neltuma alba]|uniref:uncharacterized protein LOC114748055 n=1 Tax=Neltuma alba TaxID=207710 RepID=UPI0010A3EA98|nr:uncharacterized protein LOC114748055 [Prosopis alba]